MSMYSQEAKVRPSAGWYLLPLGLWIAAIVLAVVAWKPVVDVVNAGIDQVGNGEQISVPSDGLTVYATSQPSGGGCSLVDSSGTATALSTFDTSLDWKLQTGRAKFIGLGSTPADLQAGSYTLRCTSLARNSTIGTGRRIDLGDVTRVGLLGVIVPLVLGLAGLVVLIVLLVKRHNSKSRIKTARASAASGYPGTWTGGSSPPPPPPYS
ncbi:MAG: hypothetical protein H0V07_07465 [Propionibacteriales bacterium]|nr:hypothetical protein [Propionibacteriales bacterium]